MRLFMPIGGSSVEVGLTAFFSQVQAELRRKWRRWHLQGVLGLGPRSRHPSGSNGATCSTQVSMLTRVSPDARRSSSFQAEVSLV